MFEIITTLKFKKQRKKLKQDDKDLVDNIVFILANNQILDKKYKDHQLKGNLKEEQNYIILKIKTLLHMHIHQILNLIEIRLEQK